MTLKSYDGAGDLQIHVTMFKLIMLVNGVSDPFLCRIFPIFPKKPTLLWFLSLPSRLIHNFAELSQAFVNRFFSSRVYKKTSNFFNAIRQGPQELLREYLTDSILWPCRYKDLDPTVELHCIKRGLGMGSFADSLAINPLRSLAEFRERVVGYINMEEVQETRKAEAQTKNGKVKDSKQSQRQEKGAKGVRACPKGEGSRWRKA